MRPSPSDHPAGPADKGKAYDLVLFFELCFQPLIGTPVHALGLVPNGIANAAIVLELLPEFGRLSVDPVENRLLLA